MKPTKARLRNYVDTLKNSVEKEIREKRRRLFVHILNRSG